MEKGDYRLDPECCWLLNLLYYLHPLYCLRWGV